jgi:hypothetical protein
MQAEAGCRNFLNETFSAYDSKQVLHKGFLMHMKKNCQYLKCTSTVLLGTDNDKVNSDGSDSSSETCW